MLKDGPLQGETEASLKRAIKTRDMLTLLGSHSQNRWLLLSLDIPNPTPATTSSSQPTITCPPSSLITAIRTSLSTHFGPTAVGALGTGSSLSIKYSSDATRLAILRCARTGSEVVRGSVSLVGELEVNVVTPSGGWEGGKTGGGGGGGKTSKKMVVPARIHVVAVSGTIKKLQEHVIKMDRRGMEKRRRAVKQRAGKKKGKKAIATVEQELGEDEEAPEGIVPARVEQSSSVEGEAGQQDKAAPSQSAIPAMPSLDDDEEEDLGLAV